MTNQTTTYPHQDLLAENNLEVTALSAKTQALIAKFTAETDEDKKDAIDEKICGDIDDLVEARDKKAKEDAKKKKYEDLKKKKTLDVSKAPTATGAAGGSKKGDEKTSDGSFTRRFFGR